MVSGVWNIVGILNSKIVFLQQNPFNVLHSSNALRVRHSKLELPAPTRCRGNLFFSKRNPPTTYQSIFKPHHAPQHAKSEYRNSSFYVVELISLLRFEMIKNLYDLSALKSLENKEILLTLEGYL
jgi:hypothetical protein